MDDFEQIGDEAQRLLRAVEARAARAGSVDPEQLAQELAHVEFNPDYATDLGTTTVQIDGQEVPVHKTRNFPFLFAAYDRIRKGEAPRDPIEEQVKSAEIISHYREIFTQAEKKYPLLYARMLEISTNLQSQHPSYTQHLSDEEKTAHTATEEELADWIYISSCMYNEMARFAKSINQNYRLENLYLRPQ